MRLGTIGFQGKRLTEAREALGMTVTALADALSLKNTTVSQYEHGKATPSPEVMERIAVVLNQPRDFFLREPLSDSPEAVFWRSMAAATKTARLRATRRFTWFKEVVGYLERYMDFPSQNLPEITLPSNIFSLSDDDLEQYAIDLRQHWELGDGPLADITLTLENNGILVSRITLDAESLDAFSQYDPHDSHAYIFLSSDKECAVRSRYDAAHELGHLLLHRRVKPKDVNSKQHHKILETQAFRFASAFLLPSNTFTRDLWSPTLDAFLSLKARWKVSAGVMIKRCHELGLIDDEEKQRMWINYTRRGYKKREPLDDQIVVEKPRLIKRGFELLVDEGVRSRDQILLDLPINARSIEELSGLPVGYLTGRSAVDEIAPVLRPTQSFNVIPFQRS